jgi:hypothetical protein
VLENNINHILKPHLKVYAIGLRWFFDRLNFFFLFEEIKFYDMSNDKKEEEDNI